MGINEKSRNLYQPSRLTRDLGDKVRAFGLAQRFQGLKQPHDQYAASWSISCFTAPVLCDDTRPQDIFNAVHTLLDIAFVSFVTGSAIANQLSARTR
jgi:hypothetical protein